MGDFQDLLKTQKKTIECEQNAVIHRMLSLAYSYTSGPAFQQRQPRLKNTVSHVLRRVHLVS